MLLQPRSRQSKPSTRTAAGRSPNLACLGDIGVTDWASCTGAKGASGGRSSPKRASWTTGFAARSGGEPQKNGGEEASWFCSSPSCEQIMIIDVKNKRFSRSIFSGISYIKYTCYYNDNKKSHLCEQDIKKVRHGVRIREICLTTDKNRRERRRGGIRYTKRRNICGVVAEEELLYMSTSSANGGARSDRRRQRAGGAAGASGRRQGASFPQRRKRSSSLRRRRKSSVASRSGSCSPNLYDGNACRDN